MSMSIVSFGVLEFWSRTLYQKKGGQCSFYLHSPIKSRFLLNFGTKKQVVFDTTHKKSEEKEWNY